MGEKALADDGYIFDISQTKNRKLIEENCLSRQLAHIGLANHNNITPIDIADREEQNHQGNQDEKG